MRLEKDNKSLKEALNKYNIRSPRNNNSNLNAKLIESENENNKKNSLLTSMGNDKRKLNARIEELENDKRKLNARIEELEKKLGNDAKVSNPDKQTENRSQPKSINTIINNLYAGSFNNDTNTFYAVNDAPTDKTIFVLSVNSENCEKAEISIYPDSIDKILGCKEYLDGVCDYSGSGNRIIVDEKGSAIRDDNVWRIDKKMIIKFIEK